MKMIIGLGNPGKKYEKTKHNVGFMALDKITNDIDASSITSTISKFNAIITEARFNSEKILLVKPLTYMNLSGEAIRPIMDWYKLTIDDILVIYDDLDLPIGKVRFKEQGSSGGHNGIKSIIAHLGTESFKRIKIGIDRPKDEMVVDYVLTGFSSDEKQIVENSIKLISIAVRDWINGKEFTKIMSTYSSKINS